VPIQLFFEIFQWLKKRIDFFSGLWVLKKKVVKNYLSFRLFKKKEGKIIGGLRFFLKKGAKKEFVFKAKKSQKWQNEAKKASKLPRRLNCHVAVILAIF
jgi:hypothetical protein